jgi:hypothetical protein
MTNHKLDILPSTTVYELLTAYPEFEEKLISMASPFEKLRNPLIRKAIAKIATLKNISSVGNIPLSELINTIREEIGQEKSSELYEDENYFISMPDWFSPNKVSVSMIEGDIKDQDKMTVVAILREAKTLKVGEIIELTTTFLPAPGIDTMRAKGYSVWATKGEGNEVKTYFLNK